MRGGDTEIGSVVNTEVVGSDGHRPGEGQGEGRGNGIGVQIGDRHGGGRRRGTQKSGQADQVGQNGAERVRTNGKYGDLDNILHRT